MIALLDANLFVPTWIIDPLLSLAEAGLCEPAWSARVMDEARVFRQINLRVVTS